MEEAPTRPGARTRFNLAEMAVIVIASALALAMVRDVRGVVSVPSWRAFTILTAPGAAAVRRVDSYRVFGIGMILAATGLMVGLAVSAWRQRVRPRRTAWRVAFVVALMFLLNNSSSVMSREPAMGLLATRAEAEARVVPFCLGLGCFGVILAASPARPRREEIRRPRLPWAAPTAALVQGLVFYTLSAGIIPYLVLIAMEAVRLALGRPGEMAWNAATGLKPLSPAPIPGLAGRIDGGMREALIVCVLCIVEATYLSLEMRTKRATNGFARLLSCLACWIGAAWLVFVTFPRVQIQYREGFAFNVLPLIASAVVVGFGLVAMGIAAAGGAAEQLPTLPSSDSRPSRRLLRRLVGGTIALAAICVTASAIDRHTQGGLPASLRGARDLGDKITQFVSDPGAIVRNSLPPSWDVAASLLDYDALALLCFLGWILYRSTALLFLRDGSVAALDAATDELASTSRWGRRSLAILGIVLALFPAIVLASLGLMRILL